MIELDGMEDVTAHLGVLGSDELMVAVADGLREALPAGALCGRIGSDEFAVMHTADEGFDAEAMIASRSGKHRAAALVRYRGAGERPCRLRAGAAPCHNARRAHAPGRTCRCARRPRKAPALLSPSSLAHRYGLDRSEVHPARIAARAHRQRTGIALPADHRRAWRPHCRRRGACCAGPMRCAARSARRCSFRSPSRWA